MISLVMKRSAQFISMPELLLIGVAMVWGASYGLTKSTLFYTSVSMFLLIRFGLTFTLLLPLVVKECIEHKNSDWSVALPTGAILSLIFFFEVYGVSQTSASNAAFLISLNVLFTAFVEALANRQRPKPELVGLTLLSTIGVLLLTINQGLNLALNVGDICILIAAGLRALMVTMTKKLTHNKQVTNTALTCFQALVVAIFALTVHISVSGFGHGFLPVEIDFWLITLFLVLFCTLFAFYVQNYAVRKIAATKTALLMGSEPLFGALFSMLWLGEVLSYLQWMGAAILLFAVFTASLKKYD